MTTAILNYLENDPGTCFICGSTELVGKPAQVRGNLEQDINCKECGSAWTDVYVLSSVLAINGDDLTEKQLGEFMEAGGSCCPFCKGENLIPGDIDMDGDPGQEVTCDDCGDMYMEVYKLSNVSNIAEKPKSKP
jgi:transcription elongation factor Elf1